MPRWTVPVAAASAAVLLVVAVVGAVTVDPADTDGPAAPPTTTSAPVTGSTPVRAAGTIADVLPAVKAFVEKERGLRFKHPVDVELLDDDEFERRVTAPDEEYEADIADLGALLQAVGLLDPGEDLVETVRRIDAGGTLGFFDTDTKELVVRGARPTPFVRVVLAHELTHALEDQYFDIGGDDLGDEAYAGLSGLVEGSALRVEDHYRQSLSEAEQREVALEDASASDSTPDVLEELADILYFPYTYGPELVGAIVGAGGRARLDEAYLHPPSSSEQVLEPQRYLRGDEPVPVAVPVADGAAVDDGEIGQLLLHLILRSELDDDDARIAADGWGGDHFVAWKEGSRTCVRMDFVMDTPRHTDELAEALGDWADERKGAAVATGTSLRTCG